VRGTPTRGGPCEVFRLEVPKKPDAPRRGRSEQASTPDASAERRAGLGDDRRVRGLALDLVLRLAPAVRAEDFEYSLRPPLARRRR
jgi:hypothetical protein